MVNKTITLKLYNLSKTKKNIINTAMLDYTKAFQYLLDKCYLKINDIEKNYCENNGKYLFYRIAKWIDKDISRELNEFNVQPFKDSIKLDFGMTISKYLNTKKINLKENYPLAFISKKDLEKKFNKILNELINEKKETVTDNDINQLVGKSKKLRPIYFCRCSRDRNFCILYDEKNEKYFAKIYLLNNGSDLKSKTGLNERKLKEIVKSGSYLEYKEKKVRYIVVPLSFGKWQEKYLKDALGNPEIIKTARLIKKKDEYYLSVNIKYEPEEKVKTLTFLGVTRGIDSLINYTIVNKESNVILKGNLNYEGSEQEFLNKIANKIVQYAYRYESLVIVHKLANIGDKLRWKDINGNDIIPILSNHQYNTFVKILTNKLHEKGLPAPIKISPLDSFYKCRECGYFSFSNRFTDKLFICVECGNTDNVEDLGSYNVATKIIKNNKDKIKIKLVENNDGTYLYNEILGLNYKITEVNFMDELENEIKKIINECDDKFIDKKKYSMIIKINKQKKIRDIITIV